MSQSELKWALMSLNGQKRAKMNLNNPEISWMNLIDLNKPKSFIDPKYIQNDPIWAQNEPKWAKMTRLKWAAKALNELKRALMSSNFNKILPVMHVNVRHDTGYNF